MPESRPDKTRREASGGCADGGEAHARPNEWFGLREEDALPGQVQRPRGECRAERGGRDDSGREEQSLPDATAEDGLVRRAGRASQS
ncbi:hypothetical protein [Streptomyces exfoliatus]|uniref:hypothetical protein n=1 Tax=Streptomyces exfoliatus TaxID=1905 RepID=UPI0037B9351A